MNKIFPLSSPAPDIPDILGRYPMAERSDFQQQTAAVNLIDDIFISELMRIVCYNQTIYDDLRLEATEYAGLTLGVEDNPQTTTLTFINELFDQASIFIVDDDSEFNAKYHRSECCVTTGFVLQGLWLAWSRHFSVYQKMLVMLSSVPLFHSQILPVLLNSLLKLSF